MNLNNPEFKFSFHRLDPQIWQLQRKSQIDQQRHEEKLKEAYKDKVFDLIKEGDFILADPYTKRGIWVPIRVLELPHFKFAEVKQKHVGQGTGDSNVGDVIGREKPTPGQQQGGQGKGIDEYYIEMPMSKLMSWLMPDFRLPRLRPKPRQETASIELVFDDIRKKRNMSNLDKRRTFLAAMKRTAMQTGKPTPVRFTDDDLRVRMWNQKKEQSNAVIFCIGDRSGSINQDMLGYQRIFYWWVLRAAEAQYRNVEIVFVTFTDSAVERDAKQFWLLQSSGGTNVASAVLLAQEIMRRKYSPINWNVYMYLSSDGESYGTDDNKNTAKTVKEMIEKDGINHFGYVEIRSSQNGFSNLMQEINGTLASHRTIEFDSIFVQNVIQLRQGMEIMFKEK